MDKMFPRHLNAQAACSGNLGVEITAMAHAGHGLTDSLLVNTVCQLQKCLLTWLEVPVIDQLIKMDVYHPIVIDIINTEPWKSALEKWLKYVGDFTGFTSVYGKNCDKWCVNDLFVMNACFAQQLIQAPKKNLNFNRYFVQQSHSGWLPNMWIWNCLWSCV